MLPQRSILCCTRFNPNETIMGGGIYSQADIMLARLENQRKFNSEYAVRAIGDKLSYSGSNLPQDSSVGNSDGFLPAFGTPGQILRYLGIDIGFNMTTIIMGTGLVTASFGVLNYLIQVNTYKESRTKNPILKNILFRSRRTAEKLET